MRELTARPKTLNEFVGKEQIKSSLSVYIQASTQQKRQLEHILFYGTAGVGKTSLASIIANELQTNIHYVQGPSIEQVSDVLDLISMINENDIIFIDEAHKINPKCLEMFYSIMEDFVIDVKIGKEFNSQYSRLKVPKFTLICSTTNIGKLPLSFIDRFGIKYFIDSYTDDEINLILKKISERNELEITKEELEFIATHSKGTPRIALNLLNRYYDYKLIHKNLSKDKIFKLIGVYPFGLNEIDINYLRILGNNIGIPTGIKSISQQLFVDERTIEFIIEPYLLKMNLITKKTNGRLLSNKGISYLDNIN